MKWLIIAVFACHTLSIAQSSYAHHSYVAYFDADTTIQKEGVIKSLKWSNPHISFIIEVENNGKTEDWKVESQSIGMVRRTGGMEKDMFEIGKKIKVSGNPSKKQPRLMHVFNILLEDGREILTEPYGEPVFTKKATSNYDIWYKTLEDTEENKNGLYRIWSTVLEKGKEGETVSAPTEPPLPESAVEYDQEAFTLTSHKKLPLTKAAIEYKASYDPHAQDLNVGCIPKGMPTIMEAPTPMSMEKVGNTIVMRMEEYDTKRVFHMGESRPSTIEKSIYGFSVAHWEGGALVVNTDQIDWSFHNELGIPQSEDAKIVERFSLSDNDRKLNYSITIIDPEYFSSPVTYEKYFLALPGQKVLPFDCNEEVEERWKN